MPKTLVIRKFSLEKSRTRRTTVSQEMKKNKKMFSVFFLGLITAMSLGYIFKISSIATNGYEVEKYENKLANLKKENQKIMIELADLDAMYNFENDISGLAAVDRNNISYITSNSGAVAIDK